MKIKIIIEPFYSFNWPCVKIDVNENVLYEGICKPNIGKYFEFEKEVKNTHEKNVLQITHYNKKGQDTVVDDEGNIVSDRALFLKSLIFDNLNVPDVILYQSKFYPNWPGQPKFITNNLYFGFNGTYEFEFSNNSNKMYYEHLLQKELIANINNKKVIHLPSGEKVESFEFNGKLVSGNKKETATIEDLYQSVINED